MDHRIYGKLQRPDLGVYGTRRYPKGVNVAANMSPVAAADPLNRNPSVIQRKYNAPNQAAGAGTTDAQRWEYIVPPRRRAVFQSLIAEVQRSVAGAGNTMSYALIYLARSPTNGGDGVRRELIRATSHNDAAGSGDRALHTGILDLYEGDSLVGFTSVVSGSMSFMVIAQGVEYDAIEKVVGASVEGATFNDGGGYGAPRAPVSGSYATALRSPTTSGGAYAAKYPTAYTMALSLGQSESQARIAGDTGRVSGAPTMAG